MKEMQEMKVSSEHIIEYINFQFDGLNATLKKCGLKNTLSCMEISRDIFNEEQKKIKLVSPS